MPLSKIESASLETAIAAVDLAYTGTLTGGTGVVNLGSGQFYKDASGNVGIGGAATNEGGYARVLQVTGSTEAALELKTGSNFSYVAQNGTTLQLKNNATAGVMTFATEGTERARINSSGALLINRTTQANTERFTIAGNTGSQCMALISPITSAYDMCNIFNGNGQVGLIGTNGTATSYATSSDYRLKEQVQPMTGALAKVALLKPCTYKWKVDGSDGQGFIAHELDEVVPGCVTGEKDAVQEEQYEATPAIKDEEGRIVTEAVMGTRTVPKYQGIDTSFLVATLTAAIQEQQTLITALTAQTLALAERLTALEAK